MRRIYISGGISNAKDYRNEFFMAEEFLSIGFDNIVNPVTIADNLKFPGAYTEKDKYKEYMRADLKALLECTHIFMLKNWKTSKGACFELKTAKICGLEIIYA